ncbi:MAG: PA14 domain-containing protein [Candidatus Nanohaloarchaea archaeon]
MEKKNIFLPLCVLLLTFSGLSLPIVQVGPPAEDADVENPVTFSFKPECGSGCSTASLMFNTTGNLTLSWETSSWKEGDRNAVKTDSGNLTLKSTGAKENLNYTWYDTGTYYSENGHPETEEQFDQFFNTSKPGVEFGGTGMFQRRIHWYDAGWDEKPSYLPSGGYSWKAEGYIYAPESGTYTIGIDSDDASDVFVEGQKIASWYGGHAVAGGYGHSGQITLSRGWHPIKVRMEEGGGQDGVSLAWKKPGESDFKVIPDDRYANASMEFQSPGSYETEPKTVRAPAYWRSAEVKALTPSGTSVDVDYASKGKNGWTYHESIEEVPQTERIKLNVTLSTGDVYQAPEVRSISVKYSLPTNSVFHWVTDSGDEWSTGEVRNTTVENGGISLSRSVPGQQGRLRYHWYDTSELNQVNGYANDEEEMDMFTDPGTNGVSRGGEGIHSGRVHWHSSSWDAKPSYLSSEHYSWEASGYLYAPESGTYTIGIDSDDASDVFIDGNRVASYYGPHGTSGSYGHSGQITLSKGFHRFRVRMQEDTGGDGVSVAWIRPGESSFQVIPSTRYYPRVYPDSGNYTSRTFAAARDVDWRNSRVTGSTGASTSYDIDFGHNSSGTWIYNESLDDVPASRFLRFRAHLETSDNLKTPTVRKVNLSYANTQTRFREMKTVSNVDSGQTNSITYDFSSYSLPSTFRWAIKVTEQDGTTNRSYARNITVRPKDFPSPTIDWTSPADRNSTRNPVNFSFRPECYSRYGCYDVALHFNSTGKVLNWTFSDGDDWNSGTLSGTEISAGDLRLESSVGAQGKLAYRWYETQGLNQEDNYADSEDAMDKFFNPSRSGVSLQGTGNHSGSVHWQSGGGWNAKPSYLPGDHFSWKASGYLYAPESGTYTIGIDSDDASDVFIDGKRAVSWYGGHGVSGSYVHSDTIQLDKGYHTFRVRVQEHTGGSGVSVAWKRPGESSFQVIPSDRFYRLRYEDSGTYTSPVLSDSQKFDPRQVRTETVEPAGTGLSVSFLENSSGTWISHSDIDSVPQTRFLKYRVSMSTNNDRSPKLTRFNLTYYDSEVMKSRKVVTDIENGTAGVLRYDYRSGKLPQTFRGFLTVTQSNGDVTRSAEKIFRVKYGGIVIDLSWKDRSNNENGFRVYTNSTGSFRKVGSTGPNEKSFSYNALNIKDGDYVCFNVTAFNGAGSSSVQDCGVISR